MIPFARIAASFDVPINRAKDNGWDVSIRRGTFSLAGQGYVDVGRCRADQPDVQALLRAIDEAEIRMLLERLSAWPR